MITFYTHLSSTITYCPLPCLPCTVAYPPPSPIVPSFAYPLHLPILHHHSLPPPLLTLYTRLSSTITHYPLPCLPSTLAYPSPSLIAPSLDYPLHSPILHHHPLSPPLLTLYTRLSSITHCPVPCLPSTLAYPPPSPIVPSLAYPPHSPVFHHHSLSPPLLTLHIHLSSTITHCSVVFTQSLSVIYPCLSPPLSVVYPWLSPTLVYTPPLSTPTFT